MSNVDSKTIILNFLLLSSWSQKILQLKLTFQKNFVVFLSCFWTGHLAGQLSHWFFWKIQQQPAAACLLFTRELDHCVLCKNEERKFWFGPSSRYQPAMAAPFPVTGVKVREPPTPPERWQQSSWDGWDTTRPGISSPKRMPRALLGLRLLVVCRPCGERARAHALRGYKFTKKRPDIQGTVLLRWRYCLKFLTIFSRKICIIIASHF